jgi:hypothetical protein
MSIPKHSEIEHKDISIFLDLLFDDWTRRLDIVQEIVFPFELFPFFINVQLPKAYHLFRILDEDNLGKLTKKQFNEKFTIIIYSYVLFKKDNNYSLTSEKYKDYLSDPEIIIFFEEMLEGINFVKENKFLFQFFRKESIFNFNNAFSQGIFHCSSLKYPNYNLKIIIIGRYYYCYQYNTSFKTYTLTSLNHLRGYFPNSHNLKYIDKELYLIALTLQFASDYCSLENVIIFDDEDEREIFLKILTNKLVKNNKFNQNFELIFSNDKIHFKSREKKSEIIKAKLKTKETNNNQEHYEYAVKVINKNLITDAIEIMREINLYKIYL